jgi:hypothetical protein
MNESVRAFLLETIDLFLFYKVRLQSSPNRDDMLPKFFNMYFSLSTGVSTLS